MEQTTLDLYPVVLRDRSGTEITPGARGVAFHWGDTEYPVLVQAVVLESRVRAVGYVIVTATVDGVDYPDLYRYPQNIEIREAA